VGPSTSHDLRVQRTARVEVAGDPRGARELWLVIHGYAQTAAEMLAACKPLEREDRLLVAPEALSRFYRRGSSGPIGASWMTREAREREIADYVAYLDTVAHWLRRELGCELAPCVLGFSQGVATAWRWASRARRAPQCVVACGGGLPPDLDLDAPALRALKVVLSAGEHDEAYTPHAAQHDAERLAGRIARCEVALHAGGHELDLELLARL